MSSSDNQLKFVKGSAASKSKSLWGVVIGFFAFGALASVVLSRFISSHRLAEEIAFFVALLVLYLVVKPVAEVDATHVTDLIAVSAFYLTQLLLSLVMMRSLAIGVAVMLFGIVRKLLVKRFRNRSEDDPRRNPSQAFAAILFQSLLLGAVAFVVSELLLRVLSIWQSG